MRGATMRITKILGLVLAAATLTTGAFAASGAADPLRLALQRADMPSNVNRQAPPFTSPARMNPAHLAPLGVRGLKGADYRYTWPAGGTVNVPFIGETEKEWALEGEVLVAPGVAGARQLFNLGKRARTGFFSDVPDDRYIVNIALSSLGDQQLAFVTTEPRQPTSAAVFVRKGAVVWQLRVSPTPKQWRPARSQVLAELRKYAAKQKLRVGRG
jgi:hypothetical protein